MQTGQVLILTPVKNASPFLATYFSARGFTPTNAGLIALPSSQAPAAEP
jgi:hypothetical protein